jgi:hypothetical protein
MIRGWDKNKLLPWIQQKLYTPLEPTDAETLLKAVINGSVFLQGAGNKEFFQSAGFSFGASVKVIGCLEELIKSEFLGVIKECCGKSVAKYWFTGVLPTFRD